MSSGVFFSAIFTHGAHGSVGFQTFEIKLKSLQLPGKSEYCTN